MIMKPNTFYRGVSSKLRQSAFARFERGMPTMPMQQRPPPRREVHFFEGGGEWGGEAAIPI